MNDETPIVAPVQHPYWALLRDLLAFQVKLALDGIRDLVFSPFSIGAAIWGMLARPRDPAAYFQQLLLLGRRSDRWINLFGDAQHTDSEGSESVDQYVDKVQQFLSSEYQKGGAVKSIKDRTDRFMDRLHDRKGPGRR